MAKKRGKAVTALMEKRAKKEDSSTEPLKDRPLRQKNIPGIDLRDAKLPKHPKLDVKVDDYYSFVLKRLAIQNEEEKPRKKLIIEMLKELGLTSYETPDGIQVALDVDYQLKTKKKKAADGDEPQEGGLGESDEFDA